MDPVDIIRREFNTVCANLAEMEATHRALLWRIAEQDLLESRGNGDAASTRDMEFLLTLANEIERLQLALRTLIADVRHLQHAAQPRSD